MASSGTEAPRVFRSRASALIWFFRKSRDNWKRKCQEAKRVLRSFRAELRDVRRSRDNWRRRAEASEAENRILREQLSQERSERLSPPAPRRGTRLVKAR